MLDLFMPLKKGACGLLLFELVDEKKLLEMTHLSFNECITQLYTFIVRTLSK